MRGHSHDVRSPYFATATLWEWAAWGENFWTRVVCWRTMAGSPRPCAARWSRQQRWRRLHVMVMAVARLGKAHLGRLGTSSDLILRLHLVSPRDSLPLLYRSFLPSLFSECIAAATAARATQQPATPSVQKRRGIPPRCLSIFPHLPTTPINPIPVPYSRPPPIASTMSSRQPKVSTSELKLRRLLEHNQRLREDLARPRIRVSEASARYVDRRLDVKTVVTRILSSPA